MEMNDGDAYIIGNEPDPECADIINYSQYMNGKYMNGGLGSPQHQPAYKKGSQLNVVPESEEPGDFPADPFAESDEDLDQSSSGDDADRRED